MICSLLSGLALTGDLHQTTLRQSGSHWSDACETRTIPRSPLLTLTRSPAQVTIRPETTDHQLSHCGQSYSAQGRGLHLNFSQVLTRDAGQERRTLPESVSVEDVSANQRREHSHVSLCQPIRDQLQPSRVHYCAGCVTIDSRTQFLIW